MSKSASKSASAEDHEPQFVLKHRIVGAAVLIFFGALFLPWMLGPPSEASKIETIGDANASPDPAALAIEEELLAAIENEQLTLDEEQVYISKITPLDVAAREQQAAAASEAQLNAEDVANAAAKETNNKAAKAEVAESKAKPAVANTKSAVAQTKPAVAQTKPAAPEPKVAKEPDQQASSKPVAASKVDVGWVVQVGIYTNSDGVTKVMQDLKAKGFAPSTNTVDTNRGKGTGTRIWLGPFSQRVEAAKVKTRLTEKTGEAGFIRAFP